MAKLGHIMAFDYGLKNIGVAVGQLVDLGPAGIQLQVVLLGEADGAVALVGSAAHSTVCGADPSLGHGHFLLSG